VSLIQRPGIFFSIGLWIGLSTLAIARLAALGESDNKKIVALSTLRQLGIIILSLALGNTVLCVFHIITHALSKANLFLGVGNILHVRCSEQDSRGVISRRINNRTIFGILISVLSLRGFLFLARFFSKEQILIQAYNSLTSLIFMIILARISRITLAYCIRFSLSLIFSTKGANRWKQRLMIRLPILILRGSCVIAGYFV